MGSQRVRHDGGTQHSTAQRGFSRQESWSGLPCPPPGDLPDPGIERRSPEFQADSLPPEPPRKPSGCKELNTNDGLNTTRNQKFIL